MAALTFLHLRNLPSPLPLVFTVTPHCFYNSFLCDLKITSLNFNVTFTVIFDFICKQIVQLQQQLRYAIDITGLLQINIHVWMLVYMKVCECAALRKLGKFLLQLHNVSDADGEHLTCHTRLIKFTLTTRSAINVQCEQSLHTHTHIHKFIIRECLFMNQPKRRAITHSHHCNTTCNHTHTRTPEYNCISAPLVALFIVLLMFV